MAAERRTGNPRITPAGAAALLLDASGEVFCDAVQEKVWALSRILKAVDGVVETAPGMNNLLVLFDPLHAVADRAEALLLDLWSQTRGEDIAGNRVEFPVVYGGVAGVDLRAWADHCGCSIDEAVRRHAAGRYRVASVGAMPGNPYLQGLDRGLAMPRRSSPRLSVDPGTVIVGGMQAGILPTRAPCGWNLIGRTEACLFDPDRRSPSLLAMGDEVRFIVADVLA